MLIDGLTAMAEEITVKYTGDPTDLGNKLKAMFISLLEENQTRYGVLSYGYKVSGTVGKLIITFTVEYICMIHT